MTQATPARGVLCVGRAYCDLVFTGVPRSPSPGTEVFADGLGLHAGGGAVITAAYFAALGRPVWLAATLSTGPLGAVLDADLAALGVATDLCSRAAPGSDPQVTVVMVGQSDRAFLSRACGPAARLPDPSALKARGITHLHIGELATLVELPRLLDLARQAGLTVSLDCGWQDTVPAESAGLIGAVDVFLPNADEAAHLADAGLAAPFAPLTVIKQGAAGATAHTGDRTVSAPAQAARVLDTTGAGDAFNSGFLNCWLDKAPLRACLAAGNAIGAAAIGHAGGCTGAAALAKTPETTAAP